MRFILLDRVTELERGRRICAVKALTLAEEYLGDHFPIFPVMPGVLMIEALVQTAAMLVRVSNDFGQSIVVLEEARNVKYKSFVKPGNILRLEVEAREIGPGSSSFSGAGYVEDQPMVEARLKLRHFNLADQDKNMGLVDERIKTEMKRQARLVGACRDE